MLGKVPWSPPIVQVSDTAVAYLLCWEQHEHSGEWWAWVTWIRYRSDRPFRHVVSVPAASVRPVEDATAYRNVPRRVNGGTGRIRAWTRPAAHERPRHPLARILGTGIRLRLTQAVAAGSAGTPMAGCVEYLCS
jgi:hypothetical protein